MGYSIQYYIKIGDIIKRLPMTQMNALMNRERPLLEYRNKALKSVEVIIELENRKVSRIHSMKGFILYFDMEGYLDKERVDDETRLAVHVLGRNICPQNHDSNVIHASHRFTEKRTQNMYRWDLDTETVQIIEDMVWKI